MSRWYAHLNQWWHAVFSLREPGLPLISDHWITRPKLTTDCAELQHVKLMAQHSNEKLSTDTSVWTHIRYERAQNKWKGRKENEAKKNRTDEGTVFHLNLCHIQWYWFCIPCIESTTHEILINKRHHSIDLLSLAPGYRSFHYSQFLILFCLNSVQLLTWHLWYSFMVPFVVLLKQNYMEYFGQMTECKFSG